MTQFFLSFWGVRIHCICHCNALTDLTIHFLQITSLLKRSLTSKQPLTEHYFDVLVSHDDASLDTLAGNLYPKQEDDGEESLGNLKIMVLQMKDNSALLYAEVDGDFVDCLFGLLSIPLGSAIKSFGQCSTKGCLDNLYRSIDGSAKEFIRQDCQSLLLAPVLAPFFGCGASRILQVDELAPRELSINACFACFKIGGFSDFVRCHGSTYNHTYRRYDPSCPNKVKSVKLCEASPKQQNGGSEKGEAYVNGEQTKFVVTDDLHILPLSLASTVQIVSEAKIQTSNLVEKEITLTKSQVSSAMQFSTTIQPIYSTFFALICLIDYSLTWNWYLEHRLWGYKGLCC